MKVYQTKEIRNIAIIGGNRTGKTTLSEAMAFHGGVISRRGTVEDKNTLSDYREVELERQQSINSSVLYAEFNGNKINMIDCPGFDDFIGETISALRVMDTALMVINSQNGVDVGAEIQWRHAKAAGIPVMFAVCVAGSAILYMLANSVDITLSGDDPSKTLGVNPTLMRVAAMVTVSLTVASIVSFTGTIGFIGLVAPHIARLFVGSRQRILLPASGLVGAIMLLVAADIVRVIGGLPVGAITTIIGCPIFILLLIKNRNANWF